VRRGDIRIVEFGRVQGAEARLRRPAVIVSNDGANRMAEDLGRGTVTVVPLTSNTARVYRFQALLPAERTGLDRDSKAQAEQVRSVDVSRVGRMIGVLPDDLSHAVDDALRMHLGLA
jgi:mRNA interferase MazF